MPDKPISDGPESLPNALEQVNWDAIPEKDREIIQTVFHAQFEMIQSPLLPPRILKEYNDVIPGLAEKLVIWTEAETVHRREMEIRGFEATRDIQSKGQLFGLIVSIFGLSVAASIVYLSPNLTGGSAATAIAIVSVGGPFAARLLASRFNRRGNTSD